MTAKSVTANTLKQKRKDKTMYELLIDATVFITVGYVIARITKG